MNDSTRSALQEQAVAWVVRVGDPAFEAWEAFERWLEADPAHGEAYHKAATREAAVVEALATAARGRPDLPTARSIRRWPAWGAGAVAAMLVGLIGYQHVRLANPAVQTYATRPGERRAVALADGSRVTLNGSTRLVVDGDARSARLERGQGVFVIRHDSRHPFRLTVGDASVTDVGTVFDVARDDDALRVQVAEGAVDWTSGNATIRLGAGQALRIEDGSGAVALTPVAPAAVGSWAQGELVLDGVPLAVASAELSRALGIEVVAPPAIAGRIVRGSIRLDGGSEAVVQRFAALLGLVARLDGKVWRLTTPP